MSQDQIDSDDAETPKYLPTDEVVGNLKMYRAALDAETEIVADLIAALESGELAVNEMVEAMPDPMPMYQWDATNSFDETADYELRIGGEDGGE